jgi:midasin
MSSGTDVGDLVGGFKPIDCRVMLKELFYQFVEKFTNEVPGAEKNKQYVNSLIGYYEANKLELLLKSLIQSIPKIKLQLTSNTSEELKQWDELYRKFSNILANLDKIDSNLVFSFMEGNLVTALKNGDWVLVDEINLATNDVLQKIVPLV